MSTIIAKFDYIARVTVKIDLIDITDILIMINCYCQ